MNSKHRIARSNSITKIALMGVTYALLTSTSMASPENEGRLTFGKSEPTVAFCDPSRASSSSSVESVRGFSLSFTCGVPKLIYKDVQIDQVSTRAAFNDGDSPGITLMGLSHAMNEAIACNLKSGDLFFGGAWYKSSEKGLGSFEFKLNKEERTAKLTFAGSKGSYLLVFGEPNELGYSLITRILGPEGTEAQYSGTAGEPIITYIDNNGQKTTVSYDAVRREGNTTFIDKTVTDAAGAKYHVASFAMTAMKGTNYITQYYDAESRLGFAYTYTDGLNTISLPEAFGGHQKFDNHNGQLLRTIKDVIAYDGPPSDGRELPQYKVEFKGDTETPLLFSASTEKANSIAEARIGPKQFFANTATLSTIFYGGDEESDSSEDSKSRIGFVDWSTGAQQNQKYPDFAVLIRQNYPQEENTSGAMYSFERDQGGAILKTKLHTAAATLTINTYERNGFWVTKQTDFDGNILEIGGNPLTPSNLIFSDATGRFRSYGLSWTKYTDPRNPNLIQSLITQIVYTDSAGRRSEEKYEWNGDKLAAVTLNNGQRIKKDESSLSLQSAEGELMAQYEYANTQTNKRLAVPGIFTFQQTKSGATTTTTSSFMGGETYSAQTTDKSDAKGYVLITENTGQHKNAEGDTNQTSQRQGIFGSTSTSTGEQGSSSVVSVQGEQQSIPNVRCDLQGVQTDHPTCSKTLGFAPQKETEYGGGGLGISGVSCGEPTEDGSQIINIKYTNAYERINASATLTVLGDYRRKLADGRTEFTNIQEVGTLICNSPFDWTGTLDAPTGPKEVSCILPKNLLGGEVLLVAGLQNPCSVVLDDEGIPSHCAAPPFRSPPPSFIGVYSNAWVFDCASANGSTPTPEVL